MYFFELGSERVKLYKYYIFKPANAKPMLHGETFSRKFHDAIASV